MLNSAISESLYEYQRDYKCIFVVGLKFNLLSLLFPKERKKEEVICCTLQILSTQNNNHRYQSENRSNKE